MDVVSACPKQRDVDREPVPLESHESTGAAIGRYGRVLLKAAGSALWLVGLLGAAAAAGFVWGRVTTPELDPRQMLQTADEGADVAAISSALVKPASMLGDPAQRGTSAAIVQVSRSVTLPLPVAGSQVTASQNLTAGASRELPLRSSSIARANSTQAATAPANVPTTDPSDLHRLEALLNQSNAMKGAAKELGIDMSQIASSLQAMSSDGSLAQSPEQMSAQLAEMQRMLASGQERSALGILQGLIGGNQSATMKQLANVLQEPAQGEVPP